MAKLTQEKILNMTEQIIAEKGLEKTTLYDIAQNLGVTHAALYKHYRNKDELLQTLALRWLTETSANLLAWQPSSKLTTTSAILHDWLWLLATTKKHLYNNNPRMFVLYTDYIEKNSDLVADHLNHLANKIDSLSDRPNQGEALLTLFVYFHNPYFAPRWNKDNYTSLFESAWQLVTLS